jgi:hypothetical protein
MAHLLRSLFAGLPDLVVVDVGLQHWTAALMTDHGVLLAKTVFCQLLLP